MNVEYTLTEVDMVTPLSLPPSPLELLEVEFVVFVVTFVIVVVWLVIVVPPITPPPPVVADMDVELVVLISVVPLL